jgi:hypothetical protein
MTGTGTTVLAGTATGGLSGGNTKIIRDGRIFENFGQVTMSGGVIQYASGTATIVNRAGGEWEVIDEADFGQFFGGTYNFINEGAFRKTGAGTTTAFNPIGFSNSGVLTVEEGTIQLHGGGSSSGSAAINAGAGLVHSGGTHTLTATATIAGAGSWTVSGGTVTVQGATGFDSDLSITGGTLNANGLLNPRNLVLSSGTLGGTAVVTAVEGLTWTGGTMTGTGTTVLGASATGVVSTGTTKVIRDGRMFESFGQVTMSGGVIQYASGTATIVNRAGAEWEVIDEADFGQFFGGSYNFINEGTLRKSGAGTTTAFNPIGFNNSGAILVEEGGIDLHAGLAHSGTITLFADSLLSLRSGNFTLTAGSQTLGTGRFRMQGGTISITESPTTIAAPFEMAGGTLNGVGRLLLTGGFDWSAGTMTGAGVTELAAGTENLLSSGNTKVIRDGRTLENFGQMTMSGGVVQFASGTATIVNRPSAEWEVIDEADFGQFFGGTYDFNNEGTFRKTGAGTTTTFNPIGLTSTGPLVLGAGEINLQGGGTLAGPINIGTGGTLRLSGGGFAWNDGLSFAGDGSLIISRPLTLAIAVNLGDLKVTFEGAATVSGLFAISVDAAGEIHVNKTMTFPNDLNIGGLLQHHVTHGHCPHAIRLMPTRVRIEGL